MTVRIINCDVMEGLRQLADESVHCVVTSPPYFGLRDYGVAGQIGLEPTPAVFIARIVEVFAEVRRVLRDDGTLWLNLGDSYCNADKWGGGAANTGKHVRKNGDLPSGAVRRKWSAIDGIKPKDLMGMPWRVAFALQSDGWWLRADIIWSKPNPMPESVMDRPTKAHEYIFLLSKSERYWYDAEAIREHAEWGVPNSPESIASPYGQGFTRRASAFNEDARPPGTAPQSGMSRQSRIGAKGNANGFRGGSYVNGAPGPRTQRGNIKAGKNEAIAASLPERRRGHARKHEGFNERWDARAREQQMLSRNKRSVWTIATAPYPEAHFATFPPALPEICIKAGCPVDGTVLDPFAGAGTTALVADRLQRNAILIELNPEYAAMAERRIKSDAPLFANVETVA